MNDLFKIPVSDTALMKFERECASNLTHCYEAIRKALGEADLKHADETGLRVEKSLHWLHVLCNKLMTYFQVDAKRGMAWDKLRGTIVHDHWKPYYQIQGVTHALCNAHHLQELSACVELDKESWAEEMFDVLLKALNDPKRDIEDISKRYDEIVNQGLAYHEERLLPNHAHRKKVRKRSGHNLVIRLRDYKADTLRFLTSEGVPFTNNQAEQDIRMVKVRQKVSGCFRSAEGAMEFAKIRSVLSTARKQGLDLLEQLRLACSGIYPPEILVPT